MTVQNVAHEAAILAEGKTKIIRPWPADERLALMEHKDTISAGDGVRRHTLPGKGGWSCQTMDHCFRLLNSAGIPTHYQRGLTATTSLVWRCQMIPVEVVTRRVATGSYLKRHSVAEGTRFDPPVVEFFLKDDARHDPLISAADLQASGVATAQDVAEMQCLALLTFVALELAWARQDVLLVDLKIECGHSAEYGQLVVADIIDNDSWRIWPHGQKERMLDKQVYRNMQHIADPELRQVADLYAQVAEMTHAFID